MDASAVLVAVTEHAAERYRQRVAGTLDARADVTARVARAWAAASAVPGERGDVLVRDLERPDLVYVCRHDRPRGELVVITLWEEGEDAAVPRRFTDELRRLDRWPLEPGPDGHVPPNAAPTLHNLWRELTAGPSAGRHEGAAGQPL